MIRSITLLIIITLLCSCDREQKKVSVSIDTQHSMTLKLDRQQAYRLSNMALQCMQQEYPYKLGQVLGSDKDLLSPKDLHPAFYGCFDWHSAVHGHWLLVRILKEYPDIENRDTILTKLQENINIENIKGELSYFNRATEKSFERTYGWAWLLKLAEELHTWDHAQAKEMEVALKPLSTFIENKYLDFLPRLGYPIRVGEHSNTAFGLTFAYDYAHTLNRIELKNIIVEKAKEFYLSDKNCPITWEPSGFDFLSPCLEEIDIMRRVLTQSEFKPWLSAFLPELIETTFSIEVAKVTDRSDGKLVHLDGANFSRAWTLYGLAADYPEYKHLAIIADQHISHSIDLIDDGEYSGTHWLGSFAVYALTQAQKYEHSKI